MDDALVAVRSVHFAATAIVTGVAFFAAAVAEPAFAAAPGAKSLAGLVRHRLALVFWIAFGVAQISGAAWLVLLAQAMSGGTLRAVFLDNIVWIVVTRTAFGTVWTVRLVLAALLAGAVLMRFARRGMAWRGTAVVLAGGLVGLLAYAGHAAAGIGTEGVVHLLGDIVHLLATAAWAGALVPLALLLHAARHGGEAGAAAVACVAVRRFSTIGVLSVVAVVASGIVNSYMLAGSVAALTDTDYGRLLLVKIALFLAMVSVAADNRLRLTPRLVREARSSSGRDALRVLRNNTLIEAALAAIILAIVGVLGTLPPGSEATP